MQLASACVLLVIVQVGRAIKPLKPLYKTFPVLKDPPEFSPEELKELIESQKPEIDGPTGGNTKPQSDAGKVTRITQMIVGGNVSTRGQFPWQAGIVVEEIYFCGGSLITPKHVLTAAHCTKTFSNFSVLLGAQDKTMYEEGRVTMDTITKFVHESFNEETLRHDIAILVLPVAVASSGLIKTIRLPTKKQAKLTFAKNQATISGWGRISDESLDVSAVLNNVQLDIISNAECVKSYTKQYVQKSNICASGVEYKATCNGDSGGPLVFKDSDDTWVQVGIVSFGSSAGCAKGLPSVFTRVSAYLGWISRKAGIKILSS